ncbi:heme NO-binding domain-containing protein [Agitococcus lubricus]|nr:heme NO-binding domain-containing protein [Agitococcus lubricus]
MKGIVFNLLEEVVSQHHGVDMWDTLLEDAKLTGIYTSLGSYPDGDMHALVMAAAQRLSLEPNAVLRWFGQQAMPILAQRYPIFFAAHTSTRPFLMSLNHIIHPEVKKIYAGAEVPIFDFQHDPDGSLLMGYHSARHLCALAQGFAEGAASYYHETLVIDELNCMHRGDSKCLFHIQFQQQV